jgi:outer membrane protein OmpA-like peptidoglycan-associated protein
VTGAWIRFFIVSLIILMTVGCPLRKSKIQDYKQWNDYKPGNQQSTDAFVPQVFTIFYGANQEEFDPVYLNEIALAVDELGSRNNSCMVILGYADCIGSIDYNRKLALERATWVEKNVLALGVDKNYITKVEGRIKKLPENATREERNQWRKTEIHIMSCLDVGLPKRTIDPEDPFRYK